VTIRTLTTPHDAAEGVAFVVEHAGKRLGILTDLGHVFSDLWDILPTLDALYLESNYDPEMLARGPYPPVLQQRIRGAGGHLSNDEAAQLLSRAAGRRLQWVALAHLSGENNHPDLAADTHRRIVGSALPIAVTSRDDVSPLWQI